MSLRYTNKGRYFPPVEGVKEGNPGGRRSGGCTQIGDGFQWFVIESGYHGIRSYFMKFVHAPCMGNVSLQMKIKDI